MQLSDADVSIFAVHSLNSEQECDMCCVSNLFEFSYIDKDVMSTCFVLSAHVTFDVFECTMRPFGALSTILR